MEDLPEEREETEYEITELDLAPIKFPQKRKKALRVYTNELQPTSVIVQEPPAPAPVFHDTPIENHIDDDLTLINVSIANLQKMWSAVSSVSDACHLARDLATLYEKRRRLANKQLGSAVTNAKDPIWHIPD